MKQIHGTGPGFTRRELIALAAAGLARCRPRGTELSMAEARKPSPQTAAEGRLTARPGKPMEAGPTGVSPLGLGDRRDGFLAVPAGYRADRPAPLALMLHGAGGNAGYALQALQPFTDKAGVILLVPDSRDETWDVIAGGYGPDVAFLDRALSRAFARYAVDPAHVAVGGFSDGASCALSLGITNGDLFTHVLAFSPGFVSPAGREGRPRLYVSHGTRDEILPIETCSRAIVPRLRRQGYEVRYREFDGPHTVPPEIVREALDWFL